MANSPVIEHILTEKKITTFLQERGIFPARQSSGRLFYHCPIHEGDNTPSFVVYTNDKYENYYCFSCHSGSSIINLISDIDKISIGSAIKRLAKGININEDDALNALITALNNKIIPDNIKFEELILKLSRICYSYFEEVNFDEEEINFFDEVFKRVDILMRARDNEGINEIYEFLTSEYGFLKRKELYNKKQEEKELKNVEVHY